jgi:acetyl esterase
MLGDAETHDRLVREIAIGAQATVVFVEYTRSPQAKYPVATEQAYTATAWVAEHGAAIGVDASRLAVAGDDVGGTLATVTTLLAKERGGPPIAFQVLLYPVTDANFETPSYQAFGAEEGYWLTRYLGAIHELALLNPIAGTPPARAALAQVIDTLRTVFAHNV